MNRDSGSGGSWLRRSVCAIGAMAAGVLAVLLAGDLVDSLVQEARAILAGFGTR